MTFAETMTTNLKQIVFFVAICAFVCSAFTLVASVFLLLSFWMYPDFLEDSLFGGILLRILLFTALAVGSVLCAVNLRPEVLPCCDLGKEEISGGRSIFLLPLVLLFMGLLAVPNLGAYPWTAPDETHHLIVAKNIAVHGRYASGHPDVGFRDFDTYDSVGAPVLLPIAAALKVGGISLAAARGVMALYFLLFGFALYAYIRSLFDDFTAALSALLATMTFSSIYLGRTLYGEVPALFYFLIGLGLWRAALLGRGTILSLFAGIALGLAILTKTIMILCAFPFLGALLYDRLTIRQANRCHVLLPALGVCLTIGSWWAMQAFFAHDLEESVGGTLGTYDNYLLFGIGGVWGNIKRSLFAYPLAHIVCLVGMLAAVPLITRHRPDLSAMVFLLMPVFYGYWWLFFTPGQLARYRWLSYVLVASLVAVCLVHLVRWARSAVFTLGRRMAVCSVVLLAVVPYVHWTWGQAREVYTNREMLGEEAVANYLAGLSSETKVATTFYPLRGTLHFLTSRWVDGGENVGELLKTHSVVIVRRDGLPSDFLTESSIAVGKHYLALHGEPLSPTSAEDSP